jgi:hypothetical protein
LEGVSGDRIDAMVGRISRRLAVVGIGAGLFALVRGQEWPAAAKEKSHRHKAGGSGGKRKHRSSDGANNEESQHKGNRERRGHHAQRGKSNDGAGPAKNHQQSDRSHKHGASGESGGKQDNAQNDVHADIVGGAGVPATKYPFQVALLDKRNGKKGFTKQFCGGSLIDAQHVLTAAHCVASRSETGPKNLRVLIGTTALNSKQGQTRHVATITVHPSYDGQSTVNDAAVLRLDAPVDTSQYPPITPAGPADKALELAGATATVTGWGSIHQHVAGKKNRNKPPKYSHTLREVQIPIVADDQCVNDYADKGGGHITPEVQICAGQSGLDSCWGDSGGPLFEATQSGYIQVGIVSWGGGCAAPDRPGVYTRVSAISDFIQSATA